MFGRLLKRLSEAITDSAYLAEAINNDPAMFFSIFISISVLVGIIYLIVFGRSKKKTRIVRYHFKTASLPIDEPRVPLSEEGEHRAYHKDVGVYGKNSIVGGHQ